MTMDPRLQAWLDGELEQEELPEPLRTQADDWTTVLEAVQERPAPGAPPGATERVMAAVRADAAERPSALERLKDGLGWLARPRPIRMPPLAAAALLALAVWTGTQLSGGESLPIRTAAVDEGQVYVQFVIAAPEASSVALAGDFNEWAPSIELSDPDRDGVWSARVALETGMHEYMFVIDGTEWRPDPHALAYSDDGFGQRNSIVAVAPLDET